MMCLACEQDAIWLAYLDSQGLLNPDDPEAVEALFAAFPERQLPVAPEPEGKSTATPATTAATTPATGGDNPFSCDDPTAE